MSSGRRVTLRAQWLGHLLRDLREANRLTLKDAAEYLQRDLSMISRFESGIYPMRRVDAMALLDLYGVEDPKQREAIRQLADEVWQKGWWERYSGQVDGSLIDLVWLESRTVAMRAFSQTSLIFVLQSREYAEALIRTVDPDAEEALVNRWVDLRISRQRILDREEPVRLSVVLDEAVLRRPVGGPDVMARQLRHLVAQAERPDIEIRVLPFSAGAHASPNGGFQLLKMEDPFPEVAYVEGPAGALYIESAEAERLSDLYSRLEKVAFDEAKSVDFVAAIAEELR